MVGGLWILYLMKNPQVLKLLNWTSVGATTQSQYNSIISQIGATFGQAAAFRETTATNTSAPIFGATNQPTPVTTAKSGAQ